MAIVLLKRGNRSCERIMAEIKFNNSNHTNKLKHKCKRDWFNDL